MRWIKDTASNKSTKWGFDFVHSLEIEYVYIYTFKIIGPIEF